MIEMVTKIPLGSCPKCGHKQFVVMESQLKKYLTNKDGEIIDFEETDYSAAGMCCNCNTVFKMMPTMEGFIPLTRLREILFDYTPHAFSEPTYEVSNTFNPMEVQDEG